MLNVGSLILGIGAWIMGVLAIGSRKAMACYGNTVLSFGLCGISLLLQMLEINRRVLLGDYSAIEDTIRAVVIASVALVGVTILLNGLALLKEKRK